MHPLCVQLCDILTEVTTYLFAPVNKTKYCSWLAAAAHGGDAIVAATGRKERGICIQGYLVIECI